MEITSFKISKDRKSLAVTISDAAGVTGLLLYTNATFRDPSKAIDLTSKLSGQATEELTITLGDVSQSYFDGLYFIEAEDPSTISRAILADTTRYRECILDKIMSMDTCDECLKEASSPILAAESMLTGLQIAVESGFVEEAFSTIRVLDKICSESCKTCGDYSNNSNANYFTTSTNS